jgi:hypothetical protein
LGLVTLLALTCLAALVRLICPVAITALGLRPRRRLTLLALTGRLIAIALVTLLSLALLALSGRLIPIALVLLSLALFPPFLAVRLAGLAALLIRLAAVIWPLARVVTPISGALERGAHNPMQVVA